MTDIWRPKTERANLERHHKCERLTEAGNDWHIGPIGSEWWVVVKGVKEEIWYCPFCGVKLSWLPENIF